MTADLSALEQRYSQMNDVEFDLVPWADLTEEARTLFEHELTRRKPSDAERLLSLWREEYETSRAEEERRFCANPRWFSLSGRLSRTRYFVRVLSIGPLLGIVGAIIIAALQLPAERLTEVLPFFQAVALLATLAIALPEAVKRLHDLDRPGSHVWLLFIPIYGWYVSAQLFVKLGTEGPNRYGADPLAESAETVLDPEERASGAVEPDPWIQGN
jgi:uncharacterized membrane protein YhaH (DUF805 family)